MFCRFSYEPIATNKNIKLEDRTEHSIICDVQDKASNRLVASTLLGQIETFVWEGFLCKEGKPEFIKQTELFSAIHNGPILTVERNPFATEILLSIGQHVFAIWNESNQLAPIVWRQRKSNITCGQWSSTKPSLFFLACHDGTIELWDLLTRTDDPCITHDLGETILTVISQHKLSLPIDILLVGDKKGNLRTFSIPAPITRPKPNDLNKLQKYIQSELDRKEKFIQWQNKYSEKNADLREPKQLLREESRKTIEQFEKEIREKDDNKVRSSADRKRSTTKIKKSKVKLIYDLVERLHQKWETMNVKRLMKTLLYLKQFDPEMIAIRIKPERDRLAYNEKKKCAVEENFRKIHDEVSEIRARLIPPRDINQDKERLKFITQNVENMISGAMEGFSFEDLKDEWNAKIEEFNI